MSEVQPGETFQHERLGTVKVLTVSDDGQTVHVLTEGGETVWVDVPTAPTKAAEDPQEQKQEKE